MVCAGVVLNSFTGSVPSGARGVVLQAGAHGDRLMVIGKQVSNFIDLKFM